MTRKIVSDMIVSKKSIRQIPISLEKKNAPVKQKEVEIEDDFEETEGSPVHRPTRVPHGERKPMNGKFAIWLIAGVCVLALFFGISILFSSATVIITPRIETINFNNETYVAKLTPTNTTDLAFEVLTVKQSDGETVAATEEKEVSKKATGKIMVYNNYSTLPQRLINNTRFESADGKVYRINSSVIVPGQKKIDGKMVPGNIEATIFADQAGEAYNQKLADLKGDFKIPGFKGDVRYDSFYGRLKEDITGGLIGMERIVAIDVRKNAETNVKEVLKEKLLKELYAVKPENYLMFKDGYSIDYTTLADTPVDKDKIKINIEATLNGIVFNNLKLSKYVATKKIDGFDGLPTEIIPAESLVVTMTGADSTGLYKNKALEMKLTGDASIKWIYDGEALKKDLAGKKESDLKNLANKYSNSVSSINVIFRPVWTRYFPDNLNKIKIKEETL